MQNRNWTTWVALGLAALFILWVAGILFSGWGHAGGWSMMKPGIAGSWRHGAMIGGWGFSPLGLLLSMVGLLFRLGLLALLVLGGILLWRRLGGTDGISSLFARATCAHCGQPVQSHWRHCPHCGQVLIRGGDEGTPPPTESVHV